MPGLNLSKNCKISRAVSVTNGAAGTTDLSGAAATSTIFDMEGFEGICFIITFGVITAGAVTSIKAQGATASDFSGTPVDLAGTNQTILDTDDEKVFYIDILRPDPAYRYVSLYVDRGTQNAVVHAVGIQYHARKGPVTHGTNVSGEFWASPLAGTA